MCGPVHHEGRSRYFYVLSVHVLFALGMTNQASIFNVSYEFIEQLQSLSTMKPIFALRDMHSEIYIVTLCDSSRANLSPRL